MRNKFIEMLWTVVTLIGFITPLYSEKDYILPQADYDENVSRVSFRGIIDEIKDSILIIKCENNNNVKTVKKTTKIIKNTELFTAFGGVEDLINLRKGQYVWIWYKTRNAKDAGNPPEAGVVMIWSEDPKDQPADKDKIGFDKDKFKSKEMKKQISNDTLSN